MGTSNCQTVVAVEGSFTPAAQRSLLFKHPLDVGSSRAYQQYSLLSVEHNIRNACCGIATQKCVCATVHKASIFAFRFLHAFHLVGWAECVFLQTSLHIEFCVIK